MTDVVCALIEDPEKGVLACRRPPGGHLAGLWEFPGGKVEAGEHLEDALIREILEELGVEVHITGSLDPVVWRYPHHTIRLLPFRVRIVSGEPTAHEHDAIHWCQPGDLEGLVWADADVPILRQWLRLSAGARQASMKSASSPLASSSAPSIRAK